MEKKSTVLLTVIAVATLLVAVVGSTFAFFAIQETNTADIKVDTTTAAGSDIFTATGSATLDLDVTNAVMMEHGANVGQVAVSDTDSSMKVSLQAGDGVATCTYKLTYAPDGDAYTMTEGAKDGLEYTLEGTDGVQSFGPTNMDKVVAALADKEFTIANTAGTAVTEQTWTFTAKFYNLAISQASQMDKHYTGSITVTNVNCTNSASAQ